LGLESLDSTISKDIEKKRSPKGIVAVDDNIESEVHCRADNVANQQRILAYGCRYRENRHELERVQRQDEKAGLTPEGISKKCAGARVAPLSFEDEVVQVMVEIDQKSTGEGARRKRGRSSCRVSARTQTNRSRKMAPWHHSLFSVLYRDQDPKAGNDLWVLPVSNDGKPGKPQLVLQTPADEIQGRFSPDGKWIAYVSNESGTYQVYVQSFPASGTKYQISTTGGFQPRWGRDGKELFFIAAARDMMSVDINTSGTGVFTAGLPHSLFRCNCERRHTHYRRRQLDVFGCILEGKKRVGKTKT